MSRRVAVSLRGHPPVVRGPRLFGPSEPRPGTVLDEAMRANRQAESLQGRPAKTTSTTWTTRARFTEHSPEVIEGRNMWIVWTGGNDRFWDR